MAVDRYYSVNYHYQDYKTGEWIPLGEGEQKTTSNPYVEIDYTEVRAMEKKLPPLPSQYEYYVTEDSDDLLDMSIEDQNFCVFFGVLLQNDYRKQEVQLRLMYYGRPIVAISPEPDFNLAIECSSKLHRLQPDWIWYKFYVLPEDCAVVKSLGIVQWMAAKKVQMESTPIYHIVKKGETLSGIAARYGKNYHDLARINGISNPNFIQIGQTLVIQSSTTDGKTLEHMYSQYPVNFIDENTRWVTFNENFFKTMRFENSYRNVLGVATQYFVRYVYNGKTLQIHGVYTFKDLATGEILFDAREHVKRSVMGIPPELDDKGAVVFEIPEDDRWFLFFKESCPTITAGYDDLTPAEDIEKFVKRSIAILPKDLRVEQKAEDDYWSCKEEDELDSYHSFKLMLPFLYRFELRVYDIKEGSEFEVAVNDFILMRGIHSYDTEEYTIDNLLRTITPNNVSFLSILNFNIELRQGLNEVQIKNCRIELKVNPMQYAIEYV